jgi:uncharacterized membrane protein YeaQ/YmgE (transglycosylase-associated protein family)
MFHILWSIVVGFVVGVLARMFFPGMQHMGFLATSLLGIGGSFVGGLIGRLLRKPSEGAKFHPAGFVMSIVGALIILFAAKHLGLM